MDLDFKKIMTGKEVNSLLSKEIFCRIARWDKLGRKQRRSYLSKIHTREDVGVFLKKFLPEHMQGEDLFDREVNLNEDQVLIGDERLFIGCFSSIKDNMLMWSHYANYHRGICIAYDYNYKNHGKLLYPVSYQQEFGDVQEAKLIKHSGWSYEHEWRIILTEDMIRVYEKENTSSLPSEILEFECCRIYLGVNFAKNDENDVTKKMAKELLEIAKIKQIPVRQMKMRSDRFELYDEEFVF